MTDGKIKARKLFLKIHQTSKEKEKKGPHVCTGRWTCRVDLEDHHAARSSLDEKAIP